MSEPAGDHERVLRSGRSAAGAPAGRTPPRILGPAAAPDQIFRRAALGAAGPASLDVAAQGAVSLAGGSVARGVRSLTTG
eukprot:tig00000113_g5574.t1